MSKFGVNVCEIYQALNNLLRSTAKAGNTSVPPTIIATQSPTENTSKAS